MRLSDSRFCGSPSTAHADPRSSGTSHRSVAETGTGRSRGRIDNRCGSFRLELRLQMGFQTIQGAPESFAAVLVALPDFWNERCRGGRGIQSPAQCGKIDLALTELQAFSIQARGIGDVEVRGHRPDGLDKLVERPLVMIASQFGMRNVQAHAKAVPVAEF